jgi:RNA polymerase sigma-70 factor (ECF subfamily)
MNTDIQIEEEALVKRVIAGDPSAEEFFFKLHRPRLHRASMYFLGGGDAEAEDIVQEAFMIAIPKLPQYIFKAPIHAWLRQICLRLCYARLRSRKRLVMSPESDLELQMQGMAVDRVQADALEEMRQGQMIELSDRITRLNPASRLITELRSLKGLSYAAISRLLEIPLGTVMSRLARARDQMRQMGQPASA